MTACETVVQCTSLAVLDFYSNQERKHMWSVCVGAVIVKHTHNAYLTPKASEMQNINTEIILLH